MADCSTNIYVVNNTGGNAVITLSHEFASNGPEIGGPWSATPGQLVGPLLVHYETDNPGLDFWWIKAVVVDGPSAGIYVSEGGEQEPGKECYMKSEDANQNLHFSVDPSEFHINLNSSPCSTSLTKSPLPPQTNIQHVFLLMLENRAFDHMLGYCGISGTDPVTGQQTSVQGLQKGYSNSYNGTNYPTTQGADLNMPYDPGHEFPDVLEQLGGPGATYSPHKYPPINNSGFVVNYATTKSAQEGGATSNFGEIMKCYTPDQLPVINALARNFALCDMWFSSLPGPTWPNRFFAMAASSGGLDGSPTDEEMGIWEATGFSFQNGTIFDQIKSKTTLGGWQIYAGSFPPIAAALSGVPINAYNDLTDFANDLKSGYGAALTLIEPNYGDTTSGTYVGGNSQHPMDSVASGEALIKTVYEAIRNSSIWNQSLLIVTYDEHGGFFDHVAPPAATPPGDSPKNGNVNQNGFTFDQYGVRVPAVLVSPYIPANLIDHTVYDHSCISVILNNLFNTSLLTNRDKSAHSPVKNLMTLQTPRTDCPSTLPAVNPLNTPARPPITAAQREAMSNEPMPSEGNFPGFMQTLLKGELELSPPDQQASIIANFKNLKTKGDAYQYQQKVLAMVQASKAAQAKNPPPQTSK